MAGNLNSGRKTKAEEKEAAIKEITELALLELARNKVFKHLNKSLNFKETKEMALPIVVKGMAQKHSGDPENRIPIPLLYELHNNDSNKENIPGN